MEIKKVVLINLVRYQFFKLLKNYFRPYIIILRKVIIIINKKIISTSMLIFSLCTLRA